MSYVVSHLCLLAEVQIRVKRNENFGKLQAGYLFPEVVSKSKNECLPIDPSDSLDPCLVSQDWWHKERQCRTRSKGEA